MAEVIQVQLDIKTKKAQKGVDNLTDEIVNLNFTINTLNTNLNTGESSMELLNEL